LAHPVCTFSDVRPLTNIFETFQHDVYLATLENLLCRFPENTPKINEGQKRALCYSVLFNHIRQMAPIVDTNMPTASSALARQRAGLARAGLCHASSYDE